MKTFRILSLVLLTALSASAYQPFSMKNNSVTNSVDIVADPVFTVLQVSVIERYSSVLDIQNDINAGLYNIAFYPQCMNSSCENTCEMTQGFGIVGSPDTLFCGQSRNVIYRINLVGGKASIPYNTFSVSDSYTFMGTVYTSKKGSGFISTGETKLYFIGLWDGGITKSTFSQWFTTLPPKTTVVYPKCGTTPPLIVSGTAPSEPTGSTGRTPKGKK